MAQILKLMCIHLLMGYTCTLDHVFLETPAPLNVTIGSVADFNCRVNTSVTSVFFLLNCTSITMLDDENVSSLSGSEGLSTLHINANVEYNNSIIQCGAFIIGEGEFLTDPVLLLVQVFLETPAPLNVTVGNVADFNCRVSTTVSTVFFQINGTSVTMLNDDNVNAVLGSEGLTTLHINANVEYNNTVIECVAIFLGEGDFFTDPVLLMVQGPLAAPSNLNVANRIGPIPQPVVLRWDAPFSLDISGVVADISNYTVFITNLNTSRNGSVTISETELEFTNLMGEDFNPCYKYSFTVIAMNLAGEGNSSEPVMGNIRIAPQAVPADRVDVTLTFNVQNSRWTICMDCELALPDCPGREPEIFMVHVTNDDGSFGCVHSDMTAEPIGEGRLRICFTEDVRNLILDEFYRAGIFAINSAGNTSSNGVVEFTTFDLQNVIIHLNGTVVCQYIGGSVAQGCLVIAHQNDKIVYGIFRIQEDARNFTFATESGGVVYEILGFDLEQNGTFGTQAAVSQRNATTMGILMQDFDNSAISEATAVPGDDGLICANCTFVVGSHATGCAIILHALENMQQLLSHTISQDGSGTFAQGCFPVFSSGNFSLAIFAVGSNGPLRIAPVHVQNITILEAATTRVVAAVVVVLATVVMITVCYIYHCCKKGNAKDQAPIEMEDNMAYEVHKLPHSHPQQVELQPCAAYGVVS